jgi:hypothetical protein
MSNDAMPRALTHGWAGVWTWCGIDLASGEVSWNALRKVACG